MTHTFKPGEQPYTGLSRAAEFANFRSDRTTATPSPKNLPAQCVVTPPGHRVTFFFDGTGNNLDADIRTGEHSNVARLFLSHRQSKAEGAFAFYVPGIGTYFRDIGDPGDEATGSGAGGRGEARLEWAMKQLDESLARTAGRTLHLSLFGFSRGAALARAFALRVAKRCVRGAEQGTWLITLGPRQYPLRLYFMGLFDTVASVGVPMGANNANFLVSGLGSTRLSLWDRGRTDLYRLAFGDSPGADPAPGLANGHMAWADDLTIPELVEDCLHMMAAHELRNSFPVDSLLQGRSYAPNCREMVYPGAHSDVGGGYRPGEGARSRTHGSLLSLIPLRAMHAQALRAGVPLEPTDANPKDFAEDPTSKRDFATLCGRFNAYMKVVGGGGVSLGTSVLAHMKLYYQWRFHRIARDARDRKARRPTRDEDFLGEFRPVLSSSSRMTFRTRFAPWEFRSSAAR